MVKSTVGSYKLCQCNSVALIYITRFVSRSESGHCIFQFFVLTLPPKYFRRISLSLAVRPPRSNRSIAVTHARFFERKNNRNYSLLFRVRYPPSLCAKKLSHSLFTTQLLTKTRGIQSILSVIFLHSLALSVAHIPKGLDIVSAPVDSRHKNTSTQARPYHLPLGLPWVFQFGWLVATKKRNYLFRGLPSVLL